MLNLERLRTAVAQGRLKWRTHALERVLERGIEREQVLWTILNGDVIEEYAASWPHPAVLILGMPDGVAVHAVVAYSPVLDTAFVVSAYNPDEEHFEKDFRTRRSSKA